MSKGYELERVIPPANYRVWGSVVSAISEICIWNELCTKKPFILLFCQMSLC